MGIFDEFHEALSTAVNAYQLKKASQKKVLSEHRQKDLIKLSAILTNSQNKDQRHAILLQQAVVNFIKALGVHPLARVFPSLFGSDLDQAIQQVLDNPHYNSWTLMAKEQIETNLRQEKTESHLKSGDVTHLVDTIETLEQKLKLSERTCTNLTNQCNFLQLENAQLRQRNLELENAAKSDPSSDKEKPRYTPQGVFTSS